MLRRSSANGQHLTGHALRNENLRRRSLARSANAPPLARAVVEIRASELRMTRLELARRSGIGRGTLRDLELGVHRPTRQTLQRFIDFISPQGVPPEKIGKLLDLYTGPCESVEHLISRLELRAGSARELARRGGISASTLWEYRRGNFPLSWSLLEKLCRSVGQEPESVESLWHACQRRRLIDRGYPAAWAEFCVWCDRENVALSRLTRLGVTSAALRRLRYLELPPWQAIAQAARKLGRSEEEIRELREQWNRDTAAQRDQRKDEFGQELRRLRLRRGLRRRELADLFGVGGKKPARIIKYIEEDGYYSVCVFPAGLVAVLAESDEEQQRLLALWRRRRAQFVRRRRPETRGDLRLAREMFGLSLDDVPDVLGYTSLEYQRIERGVEPISESAGQRILEAFHRAGRERVAALLERRASRLRDAAAWKSPATAAEMVSLLARREGGLAPLARQLQKAGCRGVSVPRLRAVTRDTDLPAWFWVQEVARATKVSDLARVRDDWQARWRQRLKRDDISPLAIELRILIAETANSVREFSRRLPFNYSVLVRDLGRIDRGASIGWFHVERILAAAGLATHHDRWQEVRVLWCTLENRLKRPPNGAAPALLS
ncbi:MAG TPA: helix-turn-helix transcriptional regulator [Pirellulales bacterium]|nr:helix-turn-helix transcriptional regulator [Pirellulales bacterium]